MGNSKDKLQSNLLCYNIFGEITSASYDILLLCIHETIYCDDGYLYGRTTVKQIKHIKQYYYEIKKIHIHIKRSIILLCFVTTIISATRHGTACLNR